jgi:YidC/Oxa1 family membrane protein insertase
VPHSVVSQLGELKALGLCNFTPAGFVEQLLECVHVYGGLPWWGSVVATTLFFRTLLFPLVVKTQRNNAKLFNLHPDLKRITDRMQVLKEQGNIKAAQQESLKVLQLYKDNGANPLKGFMLPLVQAPLMFSFFYALRGMAQLPVPSLSTGGALWFLDLTIPDPIFVLPLLTGITFLGVIEVFCHPDCQALLTQAFRQEQKLALKPTKPT